MGYCNPGDKVKITYQFKNSQSTTYESNVSPIDVTTGKVNPSGTANYNSEGYRITFNSPQGAYGQIQITVVDYQLYTDGGNNYIRAILCGQTSFSKNPDGSFADGANITSPVVIDNTVHCPVVSTPDDKCEITILSNGQTLFQAQGDCPVNFTVACGDECPNGYCKIDCETYPGYCCINEAEIKSLSNQLKS
ncbi:MAG: hypothetical protein V7K88_28785 [Nostoc sp.]|uniref:hypothetical protein n=1 Tax=Nostoc sp. TaxID=1180 RepID=UPI002FFBFBBF